MIRKARTGDTVSVKSREMTGRSQILPWWLWRKGVKTTENKILSQNTKILSVFCIYFCHHLLLLLNHFRDVFAPGSPPIFISFCSPLSSNFCCIHIWHLVLSFFISIIFLLILFFITVISPSFTLTSLFFFPPSALSSFLFYSSSSLVFSPCSLRVLSFFISVISYFLSYFYLCLCPCFFFFHL